MDYRNHQDYLINEQQKNRGFKSDHNYTDDEVVSLGAWILILILTAIPIVNIITVLVLAFGHDNENLNNYGKAALILMVLGLFLAMLTGGCSMY
ncbi:hypothetical protein E3U55_06605 [Filobacillus milosensis]|uniref:Uncharacterized protein n=1 Tax=Filobacillus milosensis TaxID=94137 RepID=A0A4Y8IN79_9BACI|nr:hypothetical protein [Filobacillus milosensis]TFB22905.1 hypothetical protein E3U55_06605 [Filobacillus milosensis]